MPSNKQKNNERAAKYQLAQEKHALDHLHNELSLAAQLLVKPQAHAGPALGGQNTTIAAISDPTWRPPTSGGDHACAPAVDLQPTWAAQLGRKCGGGQCTRSRKPGKDYCLSHLKNLKYGSILDESIEFKAKGKRGRKPTKQNYPPEEYIAVSLEVIDDKQYLVDYNSNVYSYCKEAPVFIGKKNTEGDLVLAKDLQAS